MKGLFRLLRGQRDNIRITDEVTIELIRDGKVITKRVIKGNLITSAGKAAVAARIGGVAMDEFIYLAVGTDDTGELIGDTTLGAEITTGGLERHTATVTRETTTVANDTLQLLYEWTASAAHAVKEYGSLNAAVAGTLLAHKTFDGVNVANTDHLKLTAKYPITAA